MLSTANASGVWGRSCRLINVCSRAGADSTSVILRGISAQDSLKVHQTICSSTVADPELRMYTWQLPLLHLHHVQPWCRQLRAVSSCFCPAHACAVKVWPLTRLLGRLENYMVGFRKARVFWCYKIIKPHFDCIAKFSEMSQTWAQEGKLRLSARMRGFLQICFDDS